MSPNELTAETNKRMQQIFLLAMIVTQLIYGSITLLSGCDTLPRTSEESEMLLAAYVNWIRKGQITMFCSF